MFQWLQTVFGLCRDRVSTFWPPRRAGRGENSVAARELVKARPVFNFEDLYIPLDDNSQANALFLRLRRDLYKEIDARRTKRAKDPKPMLLREAGKVAQDRPYFYIQPLNEEGWLFERSGTGWVVSRAHKVPQEDKFLRHYEPWDIVTLHRPREGEGTVRVTSQRLGATLISFPVYTEKLNQELHLV